MAGMTDSSTPTLAFIGGGNMARAILGGLIRRGHPLDQLLVVEPSAEAREHILTEYGLSCMESAGTKLNEANVLVWAIKPQTFKEAAAQVRPFCPHALHLSVAAGIRTDSLVDWLGTQRIVRGMPNTPALVGLGQTGLFARDGVTAQERSWVEHIVACTGDSLWVAQEPLLDAVTALSGSGPAYVFFFIETMVRTGIDMGLTEAQAHQLAVGTFVGASALARNATESPSVLRERVTSKGGTTHAAITAMQTSGVPEHFRAALMAACERARELGDEFGR